MVSFGFYNSINHDRIYDADEFSSVFDGILSDGVFRNIGSRFLVQPTGTPNTLLVGSGRAWFNHTWTYNDAPMIINTPVADVSYSRGDYVVLEVDRKRRTNRIYYLEGDPAPSWQYPTLKHGEDGVWQYPLASIVRLPLNEIIDGSQMENHVGSSRCPWATGFSTDEFATLDARKVNRSGDTITGNLTVSRRDGTSTTIGQSYIMVGNNIPKGFPENSKGFLRLYCANTANFVQLSAVDSVTAYRNVRIPDKDGTIALLQDVSDNMKEFRTTVKGWLSDGSVTRVTNNDMGDLTTPVYMIEGRFRSGRSYVPDIGGTYIGNVTIDRHNGNDSYLTLGNDLTGNDVKSNGIIRLYGIGAAAARVDIRLGTEADQNRVLRTPNASGTIQVASSSSRRVKENIRDMEDEEAKKILDVDVVKFDYIESYATGKGQSGVIAEDVVDIIPEAVEISRIYDETAPVDPETNPVPSVDYRKFVPYLIKMVQMQQKKIDELQTRVSALEQKEGV